MASNFSDNKQTLELLLKCALCNVDLDDNNQPKSLPCLHTFCTPCVTNQHQLSIQDNDTFKCPVCHTSVDRLSEDSGIIENLKLDVIIEKLLYVRRLQQRERYCEMCPKQGVVSTQWCQDCDKFLCDLCLVPHGVYKPKDKVIDVSQGVDIDKMNDFILSTKCLRHEKKFKMYCSQCEICLCSTCLLEHRSCELVSIEAVVSDTKSQGQQLLEETCSHLEKEKQHIEGMKLKISDLKKHYSEKCGEIWEHVEETVNRVKESARSFITELESGTKSEIGELEKLIHLRQDHIREMEIIDRNFRQLLQSFNNVDILLNYSRIKSKCKNLLMKPNNNVYSTLHGLNTVYNTWYLGTHEMSKNIPLGRCWKDLKLTDASSLDKSSDTKEELNMLQPFSPSPVPCLEYATSGEFFIDGRGYRLEYLPSGETLLGYTGVVGIFVADDNHVLIGSSQHLRILKYNEQNRLIAWFKCFNRELCTDWCRLSSDEIYFIVGTLIFIGIDASWYGTWKKRITLQVQCQSICNCFGKILLCDNYRCVYLLNKEKTDIKMVLNIEKKESPFHKIRCGPFEDTFLLFDDEDKKLFCYNISDAKCLFSLKVGSVRDMCTDKYGNIYIAEQDEVYVLSPDSLEKHCIFAIKPHVNSYHISVKDDVFYFASDYSREWTLVKFRLHYRQR